MRHKWTRSLVDGRAPRSVGDGGGELGVLGAQGCEGGGGAEADEQGAGGVGELRLGVSESRTWGVMIEAMGSDGVSKASRSQAVR